jgi:putative membrane protein insertion efficiency factor
MTTPSPISQNNASIYDTTVATSKKVSIENAISIFKESQPYCDIKMTRPSVSLPISIRLKDILIWMVRVYQKYASWELRLSCVFTPSCSEYMILAIEKYGAIKGLFRGLKRLCRCHHPNGGIDNP